MIGGEAGGFDLLGERIGLVRRVAHAVRFGGDGLGVFVVDGGLGVEGVGGARGVLAGGGELLIHGFAIAVLLGGEEAGHRAAHGAQVIDGGGSLSGDDLREGGVGVDRIEGFEGEELFEVEAAGFIPEKIGEVREAMGIDWMNRDELSQAIPPAYAKWLADRFLRQLEARRIIEQEATP